jgi:NADPH-dependent 7-cyano-7-deazaguanine reductase QueF
MVKSGGDKMRSVGQQSGAGDERKKGKREAGAGGAVDAKRLAAELTSERQRSKALEDTTTRVADRLDAAIESVKAILARQG